MWLVQRMYVIARGRVRVSCNLSEVFSSQDTGSHGQNLISSRPSSFPAHFPSPPEEEFTIHASGAPCPFETEPGSQPHLIHMASKAMADLLSAGYALSPARTKSARKISCRECSLRIWQRYSTPADSNGSAM